MEQTEGTRYAIYMDGMFYDSYGSKEIMEKNLEMLKESYRSNGWNTDELTTKVLE